MSRISGPVVCKEKTDHEEISRAHCRQLEETLDGEHGREEVIAVPQEGRKRGGPAMV